MRALPSRLQRILVLVAATAAFSFAQPGLYAGGGLHVTRTDDAWTQNDKGYRGVAGLQVAGDNLALVLQGGYAAYASRGMRSADSSLPRGETRVLEAHLLPKFYLRRGSISAYMIGGGGPQWTTQETWTETSGGSGARASATRFDVGLQYGFGVEAEISETLKFGIAPTFHSVYWNGGREFDYASLVFYLML